MQCGKHIHVQCAHISVYHFNNNAQLRSISIDKKINAIANHIFRIFVKAFSQTRSLFVEQNGAKCRTSPPPGSRWSCGAWRSSPTTASRCWPTRRQGTACGATCCTSRPVKTVSPRSAPDSFPIDRKSTAVSVNPQRLWSHGCFFYYYYYFVLSCSCLMQQDQTEGGGALCKAEVAD